MLLGGRVAEEVIYGDVSSGAANDLEKASEIARNMITRLGMSKRLGPITYGKQQQLAFLGASAQEERNYSEETARLIDAEAKGLVEEAHRRAAEVLTTRRAVLEKLTSVLLQKEVISGDDVREMVGRH